MENNIRISPNKLDFSKMKKGQDLSKASDNLLSNIEEGPNWNNQIPELGKDINFLSEYYNKKAGNGNFLDKIGKLNKKFYTASDKYNKYKKTLEKLNDDLYLNLFQQINCYVEEIERLNKKILSNNSQELKKTIEQLNKDINEKKEKIRNYEIKIKEKTANEEKLKKEIESYKRRIIFYKDKIKIGILPKKRYKNIETNSPTPKMKTRSFHRKKVSKISTPRLNDEDDNDINIFDIGKVNKKYKTRESIYQPNSNKYLINRTEYDIDRDTEDKEKEFNNTDYDLLKESHLDIKDQDEKEKKESSKISQKIKSVTNKMISENNENIESIIFGKNKNDSNNFTTSKTNNKSKLSLKDESENNDNTHKSSQIKIITKSKPKKITKKMGIISELKEEYSNRIKKGSKGKNAKGKEKKSNIISPKSLQHSENVSFTNLKADTNKKKNVSYNNLNVISGKSKNLSSKVNNKILRENKAIISVFKDVNDDYFNSIEMLKRQEEQIKYMLRFIDLDES
jgi:hypothetical protein